VRKNTVKFLKYFMKYFLKYFTPKKFRKFYVTIHMASFHCDPGFVRMVVTLT